jgi:hypothetical protein
MGPPALLPLPRAANFYRPWKSISSARFELANHGSSGKHANHYTTEATALFLLVVSAFQLLSPLLFDTDAFRYLCVPYQLN